MKTGGHVNVPRIGASVMAMQEGGIVLIKRGRDPFMDFWSLPGGGLEWGESLADAARREMREETGLAVDLFELTLPHDIILRGEDGTVTSHIALVVFAARIVGGTLTAGDDASAADIVGLDALAERRMTPGTVDVIHKLHATVTGL